MYETTGVTNNERSKVWLKTLDCRKFVQIAQWLKIEIILGRHIGTYFFKYKAHLKLTQYYIFLLKCIMTWYFFGSTGRFLLILIRSAAYFDLPTVYGHVGETMERCTWLQTISRSKVCDVWLLNLYFNRATPIKTVNITHN